MLPFPLGPIKKHVQPGFLPTYTQNGSLHVNKSDLSTSQGSCCDQHDKATLPCRSTCLFISYTAQRFMLPFIIGKLDGLFPDDSFIDMGEIDVGRKVTQQIPPGIFWRSQVFIDHPMYLKFNVSLSKDALVGIYGRRGLPPSHTQVGCANREFNLICSSLRLEDISVWPIFMLMLSVTKTSS